MNQSIALTKPQPSGRALVIIGLIIFLAAFGVRLLSWHDTRLEVGKVQTAVTADYQRVAQLVREGGISGFFSTSSPLSDPNNLGHPPGYSILLAFVRRSEVGIQFLQMTADALAAVMIFLIVAKLLPFSAAWVAGFLAACAPQFAWNAVLLLPDSLFVLPILGAVYLFILGARKPRLILFVLAGALIGLSCWLRANSMLMTFFFAVAVPLLVKETKPWRFALAVVLATVAVVTPLTIRNAIVFHRFIPVSLGAGQTLLEGIADYDRDEKYGVPRTDLGIMKQEAEAYQRPDYYGTLFNPDGVDRERARLGRGFAIIRSHPAWFAGVMIRRAASMLRLERSRLISSSPAITHTCDPSLRPLFTLKGDDLVKQGQQISPGAKLGIVLDGDNATLSTDDSPYGAQVAWPLTVRPDSDYIVKLPSTIEQGRIRLSITTANNTILSSRVSESIDAASSGKPLVDLIQLPFVADESQVRFTVSNEAGANSFAFLGPLEVYELGPARFLWTRYPRFVLHQIQKGFLTAVMLPLAIVGWLILVWRKKSLALLTLSVVPVYFLCVQSIFHTEYRYVLAVPYFLFAFAAVPISCLIKHAQVILRGGRSR